MKGRLPDGGREVPRLEVPEDVAVLYAWANLPGARYRDFSASRREARAQARQRAAQSQREVEALAKTRAEQLAVEAEIAARQAAEDARVHETQARKAAGEHRPAALEHEQAARDRALQQAGELSRRAARERGEVARRAEALRAADELARREEWEIAEAQASAERQAQRYAGSEAKDAVAAAAELPRRLGTLSDPYTPRPQAPPGRVLPGPPVPEEDMRPERFPQRRKPRAMVALPGEATEANAAAEASSGPAEIAGGGVEAGAEGFAKRSLQPSSNDHRRGTDQAYDRKPVLPNQHLRRQDLPAHPGQGLQGPERSVSPASHAEEPKAAAEFATAKAPMDKRGGLPEGFVERRSEPRPAPVVEDGERLEGAVPAWIHGLHTQSAPAADDSVRGIDPASSLVADTLQHSRERVASRWYALRGVFDPAAPVMEPMQARARETASPVLAVFSLAGGVGKTSLTASLGRSLSAVGEKVLLADLTPQGILPFYFGATELRPGVVRTFSPPAGSADAPVSMISHDLSHRAASGEGFEEALVRELMRGKENFEHVLVDLSPGAATMLKDVARLDATILVPVAPDMNTVISLGSMDRLFAGITDSTGRTLEPRYLLTQFDASLPLHLDVREGLRQKLGHRLLPFVIRRSAEVSEALAEGMTVIDYAPESGVAADYRNLANWLRSLAAPAHPETRNARWSEQ